MPPACSCRMGGARKLAEAADFCSTSMAGKAAWNLSNTLRKPSPEVVVTLTLPSLLPASTTLSHSAVGLAAAACAGAFCAGAPASCLGAASVLGAGACVGGAAGVGAEHAAAS